MARTRHPLSGGFSVLLAVAVLATGPMAEARDTAPARAGREGRAELDALLAKQRRDRNARATRPDPVRSKPIARKARRDRNPTGKALPAICVGCGAGRVAPAGSGTG